MIRNLFFSTVSLKSLQAERSMFFKIHFPISFSPALYPPHFTYLSAIFILCLTLMAREREGQSTKNIWRRRVSTVVTSGWNMCLPWHFLLLFLEFSRLKESYLPTFNEESINRWKCRPATLCCILGLPAAYPQRAVQ